MRSQADPRNLILRRAATFITVAYVVFTTAMPARAAEPAPEPHGGLAHAAEIVTGVVATGVQLTVYGSCRALGGDDMRCLDEADKASRRTAGRGPAVSPDEL